MIRFDQLEAQLFQRVTKEVSRKNFLQTAGRGLAAGILGGLSACRSGQPVSGRSTVYTTPNGTAIPSSAPFSPPAKVPEKVDEPIELEEWKSKADRESAPTPSPLPPDQRVGYALVGLGHLTLEELLPAFGECKKSKPVALVSGSPEKLQKVSKQYGIKPEHCYSYQDYDKLKDNPEVQAIYIVLPNSMHAEYTIRGAQAGKHILCEKPMANSVQECQAMIDACQKAGRKLMIAYRIQYEANNRMVRELIRSKEYGDVKMIEAFNAQSSANPKHWRHIKALAGGGALPDIGLYCLNTIRFLLGEEPTEVFGYQYSTPGNPLFEEVEEVMSWQMRFANGIIANCATHYNTHESRRYRVLAEKGWMNIESAFAYQGQQIETSHADGKVVRKENLNIMAKNQFATEMDHFSECILENKSPYTPGEEGMQDQRIMEAIYQSAKEGKPVKLPEVTKKDAFRGPEPTNVS
ncbi:Gfo/Idh/MocA family oxidoreductase [Rhodocytophaga aerolata]|uniref:Gfo/Idh/MocA family oxidoreductase n=1 Tax=Rhodocytophaga aerolata TaxID=455078 RepID=A0ABT8RL68_9BACT|nr:Gfo/Idh/MocA family oxidoreductase [Rhodocytophaga aerolata]MDO1451782.1 Gfo/Idh/MocA family oxidoreductase [Rhodocytophaga aerolata]